MTMHLNTFAQPDATTPAQELVPSRYALRVGEIDVLVVSDGVLPLPTETMSTNATPEERAAWFKEMYLGPDMFDWALNVLVVRSGEQTILVDAGLGNQFPGFPRAGQFPKRLKDAGIELSSITDIVITHMHMDHIGGLLTDTVKNGLSPEVRIHVTATEVDFWKIPDFSLTEMPQPVPDVLRRTANEFMAHYESRLHIFEDELQVAPGVVAKLTGGHTPGHCIVYVDSAGERLTFAGDALFPVAFDHPEWHNGFEHDPEESVHVRVRLLREAAASGELFVATHLPFPSVGRVAIDGEAFRWIAGFWDY
ncbi:MULTISPECIES: MBL fold metallo-hydrolase [Pseudomonadaceae]|uniref:MBL fold metallo-hydrolase n=1 Tax=Pseudomonas denitrificans TaxID=43306 RepID=A0A9X7R4D4_PSEDE|nr:MULTISPECIES: MBL fold metallo-hydrolase [Pseudomonadaceae]MBD9518153.1 MBL fold metallo-hydrolase [Pseudomonas sp. PDM22]MBD9631578.1 MBL fold metallo-hydrolase [Pseudomonas sp. PDM19]MBD9684370.1 MBL fold metallo-hydrolase [Pseudomonas sp. PDM20]QEY72203.1 MBL fold metallo-hydrolase [Pseudomonas denitrificans (nom. rej.)]